MRSLGVGRLLAVIGCVCAGVLASSTGAQAAEVESQQGLGSTKSAVLTAKIDPEGVDTTCHVQYAPADAFEREGWAAEETRTVACSPEDLGSAETGQVATVELDGLGLNTAYEFRFLAASGGSTVVGAAETFTTFGVESLSLAEFDAEGEPEQSVQAGGHPYELVTKVAFRASYLSDGAASGDAQLKDVRVALPAGLVGNPDATPRCPRRLQETNECPTDTQIGTLGVRLIGDARRGRSAAEEEETMARHPLFNLVPPKGMAAQFGAFVNASASAYIDAGVRSGSDYGVNADSLNITSFARPARVVITMWGDPAAPSHDEQRTCDGGRLNLGCSYEGEGKPFLRNPTSCTGPRLVSGSVDSYQEPEELVPISASLPAVVGCEEVPFEPSLEVQSTTGAADSPSGLNVDVHVPQHEEAGKIASSDLKDATVTFPAGMAVSPSSADGLGVCSEHQAGFTGFRELNAEGEPGVRTAQFTSEPAECPSAAKLGTVQVKTPLLEETLEGAMYLATPHQNPFGSLLAVYLTAYAPERGVVVKLPGVIKAQAGTGQLSATFEQNPQLPFEDLKVKLFGDGKRAPLTTPETCGSYHATSVLVPWSGNPAATPSSLKAMEVTGEPGGGACPATEAQAPNAPGFAAGTANPLAGVFSPFDVELTRQDGSQHFGALNVTLPPGMTGRVAGVPECPQADIEAAQRLNGEGDGAVEQAHPSCPAATQVGVVHVGTGSGAPFFVAGKAYFAGPYRGAPFSLVIITPAIAGPFDLGTVVVRAGIYIDPETAQVTVRSDPFPSILDGIPLDIRTVQVQMTRPGFTLNPTSCAPMTVTGQEISTAGQTASLTDRFQVGGCRSMPFKPEFTALTHAHHTRKDGEYLHVVVRSGPGQANIAKVHVQLPGKLPSVLPTLKLACTEGQFAANPAGCPAEAIVGHAIARTPILPVPLQGPAVFVSHSGKGFPHLDLLLQGDGVHVTLVGDTHINEKTLITTSTFNTVPDVPIDRFDLVLPAEEHPALAGNGNMCRKPLYMPTTLTGQNGAVVKHRTKIMVTGCKPELVIRKHRVHREKATVFVHVPSAGKLIANGKGLKRTVKHVRKHGGRVGITIHLGRRDRHVLAKHPRERVNAKIDLRFKPRHGKTLHAHLKALIG